MSDNQESTDHLDRLETKLRRERIIELTKQMSPAQRREFYDDDSYPPELLREIASANGDNLDSIKLGLRQMDEATEPGENIMDAVAGTRTDEEGNEVEVTYGQLQQEANESGDVTASIQASIDAQDAATRRAWEEAHESETMGWLKEHAEQRGEEFIEKNPHLDPNYDEDEDVESAYADLPPHLRLNEDADSVGPLQAAQAKLHKAQQRGDVDGSMRAAVKWMDALREDGAA